ncbi:hypothetical protein [Natronococcus roseus]|uniref:hypothetical protein n=1 Tax=Natronococcus roseus TaxID=1052014 RepID=UPI00374CE24F
MPGLVGLLVTALIVLQVPAAILVYLDAKRLNAENPLVYFYGILVPAAGFVVVPAYLSKREELPRESADSEPADS